jgi:hypothetical protein
MPHDLRNLCRVREVDAEVGRGERAGDAAPDVGGEGCAVQQNHRRGGRIAEPVPAHLARGAVKRPAQLPVKQRVHPSRASSHSDLDTLLAVMMGGDAKVDGHVVAAAAVDLREFVLRPIEADL